MSEPEATTEEDLGWWDEEWVVEAGTLLDFLANQVTEVRINKSMNLGWHDNPLKVIRVVESLRDKARQVYVTLQDLKPEILNANPRERSTQVGDVRKVTNILFDFDAKVPVAGVPASEEEHAAALEATERARTYLVGRGWPEPLRVDSGNGGQLFFAIELEPTKDNERVVKGALKAIGDQVGWMPDLSVTNPSRVVGLPGTWNRKGEDSPDRPHRMRHVISAPEELLTEEGEVAGRELVTIEMLESLAGKARGSETTPTLSLVMGDFDLEAWFAEHGIDYEGPRAISDGSEAFDVVCPNEGEHTTEEGSSSSSVLRAAGGSLSYVCLHAHCSDWTWARFRAEYEPGYMERVVEGGDDDAAYDDDLADEIQDEPKAPLEPAIPREGFLRDAIEASTAMSMVPPEFALAVGLTEMAALLQGNWGFVVGETPYGAGLSTILVAQAGQRKSAALTRMQALRQVLPEALLGDDVTAESLYARFNLRRDRFVVFSEFAAIVDALTSKKYYKGVDSFFNDAWDGNIAVKRQERTGRETVECYYPTLTVAGATTLSHLAGWMATELIEQGFMTRLLFVVQENLADYKGVGGAMNLGSREGARADLERLLRLANSRPQLGLQTVPFHIMPFTDDAKHLHAEYDRAWADRDDLDAVLGPFATRLGGQVARLSMGYALAEGRLGVEGEDVRHAIAFTEFCRTRSWRLIVQFFSGGHFMAKNLNRLRVHMDVLTKQSFKKHGFDGGWVSGRLLSRKAGFYGRPFRDACEFFVDTGEWAVRDRKGPGPHGFEFKKRRAE